MKRTLLPLATTALAALLLPASPALAKDAQYVLRIDGITCPFCVATSEKALKKLEGVKAVSSDLKQGTITVCADDSKANLSDERLTRLFRDKGFTYRGQAKGGACSL